MSSCNNMIEIIVWRDLKSECFCAIIHLDYTWSQTTGVAQALAMKPIIHSALSF